MKELQIRNMPEIPLTMAEAFDRLRVNLGFSGGKPKVIMVTSSVPGEGKSFVARQLWKQIAGVGESVLLIDCNLHGEETSMGLAQYLAGQAELEDVLYQTNLPNGYLLPAGASAENPAALLAGERFRQMLEHCREKFDCVLIDTQSVSGFADVLNIATHCDGTVLVVRSASTSHKAVDHAVQLLKRTGTPLLGIVLNRADMKSRVTRHCYR